MKIALFNFKAYEKPFLSAANAKANFNVQCFEAKLNQHTVMLAKGCTAVCCFVNDTLDHEVIKSLAELGVRLIALRCAGFNNVDLDAAATYNITVVSVPAYSPYAVAEFTIALILNLNRKIDKAIYRVREHNFLLDGLLGFDLHQRTVGVIGTGKIGQVFSQIMLGFGCNVIAYDIKINPECTKLGVKYVELDALYHQADIISLHCPLNQQTLHMINKNSIAKMRPNVMLVNTGRGALMDTKALIDGLKTKKIGYLGLDVYEEEENLFFQDLSSDIIQDDLYARLQTFPNVILTAHQAFFTQDALTNIFKTTISNVIAFIKGKPINMVKAGNKI